jgi:putative transposase
MLTVIDEYTRKCLAIAVGSSLRADDVVDLPSPLFITEGVPDYLRSDIMIVSLVYGVEGLD